MRFDFLDELLGCVGRPRTDRAIRVEAQEKHVGAGIDGTQRAIDLEAVNAGLDVESLREDHLKRVAGADVFLRALHRREKVLFRGAMLHFELARLDWLAGLENWQRLGEALFQLAEPLQGAVVCGSRACLEKRRR